MTLDPQIQLEPKAINQILDEQFFIRDYQRGYRWTTQQVEQLLNDIDSFNDGGDQEAFYCLQPIVLKRLDVNAITSRQLEGEWFEVVDGQQRITTIFLILQYMNDKWFVDKEPQFKIDYETREKCVEFLETIKVRDDDKTVDLNRENIDFYHISNAYRTIRNWELSYNETHPGQTLTKGRFQAKFMERSKIIWYEVSQDEDGVELFERLNLGKIPLTNAELTKALFLSTESFNDLPKEEKRIKHFEIASLWDEIEHRLNELDKKFWSFLTNKKRVSFDTKIELILDLIAEKPDGHPDHLFTFLDFSKRSQAFSNDSRKSSLSDIWEDIEQFYHTIVEWNNDRNLYHLIGYLVTCREVKGFKKDPLNKLVKYSMTHDKKEFMIRIMDQIRASINCELSELRYEEKPDHIFNVLLLFNVETCRTSKSIDEFYPFRQHKLNHWSLEHIHAQNSEGLDQTKKEQWVQWLDLHSPVLEDLRAIPEFSQQITFIEEVLSDISRCNGDKLTWPLFTTLFDRVTAILTDEQDRDDIQSDGLSNMALLSQSDNSALNNSAFEVKRRAILRLDKEGSFIPVCTRRVFQNYYNDGHDRTTHSVFWAPPDREAYFNEVKTVLSNYLPDSGPGASLC